MVWKAKIKEGSVELDLFLAVFISTALSLVSMGLFLRFGSILADAGYVLTLSIALFSLVIIILTGFSISWMISNSKTSTSNIYDLLARTFGLDVSFSITAPLIVSQSLSASFYIIGCSEIILLIYPWVYVPGIKLLFFSIASAAVLFLNSYQQKIDFLSFFLICLIFGSMIDFSQTSKEFLPIISQKDGDFWFYFSLFFPVVTGIETILSSQVVKNSLSKTFSKGLYLGICFSSALYFILFYLFAHSSSTEDFGSFPAYLKKLSLLPSFCITSILFCGIAAANTSIKMAAQTLEALSLDGVAFSIFKNRKVSSFFILTLVMCGLLFKNINSISSLITLFFLLSYGMINLATGLESWIENPSWRPTLSGHFGLSFFGAFLCLISLVMISPGFGVISLGVVTFLYIFIKSKKHLTRWEDFRYSLLLLISRNVIYKLSQLTSSSKNWRPNLLVFIGDPLLRKHLTQLSFQMTNKQGFLIFSSIFPKTSYCDLEEKKIKLLLEKKKIQALIKTKRSDSLIEGMKALIEDIGLGNLSFNTVVIGATQTEAKFSLMSDLILFIKERKKNLILIKESNRKLTENSKKKKIDLWWGGLDRANSELMIIFCYMLQKSKEWRNSMITLKSSAKNDQERDEKLTQMESFLKKSRICLNIDVCIHDEKDIFSTILKSSSDADLVFLGMKAPETNEHKEDYARYYENLMKKTENFPTLAFIIALEDIDFSKILD